MEIHVRLLIQVNLCQKLFFFASTNPEYDDRLFIELQFQAQTWGVGTTCCVQKLFLTFSTSCYTTCFPHVLPKEELLTKIYLYAQEIIW